MKDMQIMSTARNPSHLTGQLGAKQDDVKNMEKREAAYTADWNTKWDGCSGKQSSISLKMKQLPYDPTILLLVIYSRKMKMYVYTKTGSQMFTAALFVITEKWKQPQCLPTEERVNKV